MKYFLDEQVKIARLWKVLGGQDISDIEHEYITELSSYGIDLLFEELGNNDLLEMDAAIDYGY